METREGIFAGDDPIGIAARWLEEARGSEPRDANAMALATVDADGLPNVRIVLLKEIAEGAFFFYTNYESAKAREIEAAGKAAFVLHWKSLNRQVRVRGPVMRAEEGRSDAYFASRPLQSRIGAWASQQSCPLVSRQALFDEVARLEGELGATPARPPFWGGYRVKPMEMELWAEGAYRLHDRFRWQRTEPGGAWTVSRLNP